VVGLVNAPIEWGGATWGAYARDFMVDGTPRFRKELMLHELFHAAQPQVGLRVPALASEHLDAADGRYWLRLEWRALARALQASGEPRALAVGDALAFRQARHMLYPSGVESERAAEITEGLAQHRDRACRRLHSRRHVVEGLKHESGFEMTPAELLAAVRRAFIRALWLERKQGYDRSDYTMPSELFDRPNPNLAVPPFVTREFFSQLSDRVWEVFDREIDEMAKAPAS
jgi:hypothetical protein